VLFAVAVIVTPAIAADPVREDWPQWRGTNRDGRSRETGLLVDWRSRKPRRIWHIPLGKGFSSFSVADGRLYTMASIDQREYVFCLDATDGRTLWKVPSGATLRDPQGGDGPRSTPTVVGGLVYTLGAEGTLLCLNAEDGTVRWKHEILEKFGAENLHWGVSMSPLVNGDQLLVNVGAKGASIVAFDKHTGKLDWRALDDVAGYASPIMISVDGVEGAAVEEFVFFCGKALVGVSPKDGAEHWRHQWITTSDMNIATPIYDPGTRLLFVSASRDTGRCSAYRLTASRHGVRSEHVYTNKNMRNHYNGCVLVDGCVYGFDNSLLKCIRLEDGVEMWKDRSVGKGSLVAAQGHLYVLGERGDLGVVEATHEGYREKGRFKALDSSRAWTPPALAHGRLYVRDLENAACIDIASN
jgi:outer membrane protein assembly factor BamB